MRNPREARMIKWRWLLALTIWGANARAEIKTSLIDYKDGKTALQGYLAYDDALSGARPGVLVVHEWKGHGDYVRRRADQLAAQGYVVFALDMYGKGVFAKDHAEAARLSGVYFKDRSLMRHRAQAGLRILQSQPRVDRKRLAAVGYCFGGTTVLEMARAGMPLKGVACFHGNLTTPTPARPGGLKAKIIVYQGADDQWTAGGIPEFEAEMKAAKADWKLESYPGAVHSFTVKEAGDNPASGMAYNAEADRRSWESLTAFLTGLFK